MSEASASKLVHTRTPGWCSNEFAHHGQISAGDLIRVVTAFPGHDFAPAWSRIRICNWCLVDQCKLRHYAGYRCEGCGYVKPRAFWLDPKPTDSRQGTGE